MKLIDKIMNRTRPLHPYGRCPWLIKTFSSRSSQTGLRHAKVGIGGLAASAVCAAM